MNMQNIGRKISELRKQHDLTQVELADKLGVTFQAVSSWERGNSMPDIAKLPDISQVLKVSVDELLGSDKAARVIQNVLTGQSTPTDMAAVAEVAHILKPSQVENLAEQANTSGEPPITIDAIIAIANHLSCEKITQLLKAHVQKDNSSGDFLPKVADYLDSDQILEIAKECKNIAAKTIAQIACHMDSEDIASLLIDCNNIDCGTMAEIAPHMDSDCLRDVLMAQSNINSAMWATVAHCMDSEDLRDVLIERDNLDLATMATVAPCMDSEDLRDIVLNAKTISTATIANISPHMDSEDLADIAARLLKEKGMYDLTQSGILDHMDEDDIAEVLLEVMG